MKPRNLKEGDLVLKVLRDGPFIIKKIMSRGAIRITNLDREEMLRPINRNIQNFKK